MSDDMWVPKTQKGLFGNLVLWVGALIALGLVISAVGYGVGWFSAPYKGKLEARKTINSGSFRIAAYNHFFDACAGIQGEMGQLAAQQQALKTAIGDDIGRVQANIAGLEGELAGDVADYNADVGKSYTIGQFRSAGLPFRIDLKEPFTCGG